MPVPAVLREIKYIDLTHDFEAGFVEVIQFMARRRRRVP